MTNKPHFHAYAIPSFICETEKGKNSSFACVEEK